MDTTEIPRRSAASAKATAKRQSSAPTLIFYGAVCLAIWSIGHGLNGFLLLALLIMVPFGFLLVATPLRVYFGLRSMYRHPELYTTKIIEDEQGNFSSISWNRVHGSR